MRFRFIINNHEYIADCRKQELTRDGKTVDITNRPWLLLKYLLQNSDRFVTNTEIIENVWKSEVAPGSVTSNIGILRKLFDDTKKKSIFIKNRTRLGYKLTPTIEVLIDNGEAARYDTDDNNAAKPVGTVEDFLKTAKEAVLHLEGLHAEIISPRRPQITELIQRLILLISRDD